MQSSIAKELGDGFDFSQLVDGLRHLLLLFVEAAQVVVNAIAVRVLVQDRFEGGDRLLVVFEFHLDQAEFDANVHVVRVSRLDRLQIGNRFFVVFLFQENRGQAIGRRWILVLLVDLFIGRDRFFELVLLFIEIAES